jgi:hypothetical protein
VKLKRDCIKLKRDFVELKREWLEGRVGRLGSPAKVQPWLVATTLGAQAAHTTPGRKAAALRESVRGRARQKP